MTLPALARRSARCAVTLANKGDEAYQHHVYGDSITIERTLNKTGGTYKIKNHEGKTVDNKKATLDSIRASLLLLSSSPRARAQALTLGPSQWTGSTSRSTTR